MLLKIESIELFKKGEKSSKQNFLEKFEEFSSQLSHSKSNKDKNMFPGVNPIKNICLKKDQIIFLFPFSLNFDYNKKTRPEAKEFVLILSFQT